MLIKLTQNKKMKAEEEYVNTSIMINIEDIARVEDLCEKDEWERYSTKEVLSGGTIVSFNTEMSSILVLETVEKIEKIIKDRLILEKEMEKTTWLR